MTAILSLTLAPPKIATKAAWDYPLRRLRTQFLFHRKPDTAGRYLATPSVEA